MSTQCIACSQRFFRAFMFQFILSPVAWVNEIVTIPGFLERRQVLLSVSVSCYVRGTLAFSSCIYTTELTHRIKLAPAHENNIVSLEGLFVTPCFFFHSISLAIHFLPDSCHERQRTSSARDTYICLAPIRSPSSSSDSGSTFEEVTDRAG